MKKVKRIVLGVGYPTFSRGMVGVREDGYALPVINWQDFKLFWCYCTGSCECKKWKLILEQDNG